jgi:hypothetical protein
MAALEWPANSIAAGRSRQRSPSGGCEGPNRTQGVCRGLPQLDESRRLREGRPPARRRAFSIPRSLR